MSFLGLPSNVLLETSNAIDTVSYTHLAVGADDFVQQFLGEGGFPGFPNPPDQRIYVGPPVFVQGNADDFRLMAQDQADIAADGSQIHGDHTSFRLIL